MSTSTEPIQETSHTSDSLDNQDERLYTDQGISETIVQKLRSLIELGKLTDTDLDNRVCEQLRSFPDDLTSVDSLFDASKPIPGGGDSNQVLTKFTLNFKPVTGVISFNYFPNISSSEFTVLDAYATYDAGNGVTVTAGKFLSYKGYESFYAGSMDQISYANGDFLGAIPITRS